MNNTSIKTKEDSSMNQKIEIDRQRTEWIRDIKTEKGSDETEFN